MKSYVSSAKSDNSVGEPGVKRWGKYWYGWLETWVKLRAVDEERLFWLKE